MDRAKTRALAVASAAALVGALGVAVNVTIAGATDSPGAGVTFSSEHGVAALVAHYVVTPTGGGEETSSTSTEEGQALTLSPKGSRDRSSKAAADGVSSDNTVPDTQQSDNTGTASPSASFIGQQSSNITCPYFPKGCNPPDMALGASPGFVLQGVNMQWEVLDTSGEVQPGWPVSAQNFFAVPNTTNANGTPCDVAHRSQPFLSDPRALYDPVDRRFWAAMLQVEGGALGIAPDCPFKTVYYISVSQTSDPTGKWNVYEFDMSMGRPFGADYTQLGINSQAVYFSANMFENAPGTGFYAELFEANKARMEAGLGGFTADGFFNLQAHGPGITSKTGPFLADTVNPAQNFDSSAGTDETFVNTLDGPDPVNGHFCGFLGGGFEDSCSGLAVWKMSNPVGHDHGGPAPILTATYVATPPFLVSPAADQPSCKRCVDALDLRFTGTPVVRNGILYGAWETAVNNGSQVVPAIEWTQVTLDKLGSEGAARTGYYNFSGDGAASFGTLMPDAQGNSVTMLFEHMSSSVFPEARYITKSVGDRNFRGAGVVLKAGESSYRPQLCGGAIPVCRWGDFEAASFDGQGKIWMAGEYANQYLGLTTPPVFGRNWGTWIGAVNG